MQRGSKAIMGVNYFQRSAAASSHEAGARINDRRLQKKNPLREGLVSLEIVRDDLMHLWTTERLTPPPQREVEPIAESASPSLCGGGKVRATPSWGGTTVGPSVTLLRTNLGFSR